MDINNHHINDGAQTLNYDSNIEIVPKEKLSRTRTSFTQEQIDTLEKG